MQPASLLDPVLGLAAIWLAWMALSSRDLFRAVVLYIVFGLVMALAWVRLRAPDVALAEAAIGAGLTGALLLDAVAQFGRDDPSATEGADGRTAALAAALPVAAVGGILAYAVLSLPRAAGGMTAPIGAMLERSGVEHPVTAVLLNFRSFDTWMEVFVLLVAVLALLIVRRSSDFRGAPVPPAGDPLLRSLPPLVLPPMVLVGGYLLWLGTHAPGGAFQAGAVLASAAVLLLLAGHPSVTALHGRVLRSLLLAGVLAFLVAAVATLATGGLLLEFPSRHAGTAILLIETAVTLSIAATLAALFAGARGPWPAEPGGGEGGA